MLKQKHPKRFNESRMFISYPFHPLNLLSMMMCVKLVMVFASRHFTHSHRNKHKWASFVTTRPNCWTSWLFHTFVNWSIKSKMKWASLSTIMNNDRTANKVVHKTFGRKHTQKKMFWSTLCDIFRWTVLKAENSVGICADVMLKCHLQTANFIRIRAVPYLNGGYCGLPTLCYLI